MTYFNDLKTELTLDDVQLESILQSCGFEPDRNRDFNPDETQLIQKYYQLIHQATHPEIKQMFDSLAQDNPEKSRQKILEEIQEAYYSDIKIKHILQKKKMPLNLETIKKELDKEYRTNSKYSTLISLLTHTGLEEKDKYQLHECETIETAYVMYFNHGKKFPEISQHFQVDPQIQIPDYLIEELQAIQQEALSQEFDAAAVETVNEAVMFGQAVKTRMSSLLLGGNPEVIRQMLRNAGQKALEARSNSQPRQIHVVAEDPSVPSLPASQTNEQATE